MILGEEHAPFQGTTSYLNPIEPKPKAKPQYDGHLRIDDIDGASPHGPMGFNRSSPLPNLPDDAHPRKLIPHDVGRPSYALVVDDIDGTRPRKSGFRTGRCVDPLTPDYPFLKGEVELAPPAPFRRDTLEVSDIPGTKPTKIWDRPANRNPLDVSDIRTPPRWKVYVERKMRDPINVADITEQKKFSTRKTDPLSPRYTLDPPRFSAPLDGEDGIREELTQASLAPAIVDAPMTPEQLQHEQQHEREQQPDASDAEAMPPPPAPIIPAAAATDGGSRHSRRSAASDLAPASPAPRAMPLPRTPGGPATAAPAPNPLNMNRTAASGTIRRGDTQKAATATVRPAVAVAAPPQPPPRRHLSDQEREQLAEDIATAEKFETYRARFISRPGPSGLSLTPGVAWAWGPAVANGPLAQCGFTAEARRWVACPAQPRRPHVARVPPVAFDAPPEKKPPEGSKKSLTACEPCLMEKMID
ncbi:hypothetical protein PAPYR_1643 [Paratrimastix pyriformis]|uniref:Uncharacterized protein n=1 Tax=Paratrimastix pyriformis TaxID=342808 RepID=A0ABQ8UUB2_9EUKA|nr:hypothetical protein PAPYR_1643 [Paratrimastix pyriformis]